jgi:hypothetical protein
MPRSDSGSTKFFDRLERRGECLVFTGGLDGFGYSQVRIDGRIHKGHRPVYELVNGPLPPGTQVHHICRVRACVEPTHLKAVTPSEHGVEHRLAVCKRGHDMHGNRYARPDGDGGMCYRCMLDRAASYR